MAGALPWSLPAFLAGMATIHLARRWARIVTGMLWSGIFALTLLLAVLLSYRHAQTMSPTDVDDMHAMIALLG